MGFSDYEIMSVGSDDVFGSETGSHAPAADAQPNAVPNQLLGNTRPRRGIDGDYQIIQNEILFSSKNKYEVLQILGRGAFGQVAKCHNKTTNEIVAIKFLKNLPHFQRQGMVEAAILAQLSQESCADWNMVLWHETFMHRSHMCLVFEMLQQSLYDYLKENRFAPLPLKCIRPILHQLLTALLKLKQIGLIHTDIKPDNIMLVDSVAQPCRVKLIDFGCATEVHNHHGHFYLQSRSPEVILGTPFSEAIDTWSLGCVVAELFLGRPLYPGNSEYEQMQYICRTQGPPPEAMLNRASKTAKFFCRAGGPLGEWRLKTPREYEEATGDKCREPRCIFLEDFHLLNEPTDLTGEQMVAEKADRREFVGLLKNILAVDHSRRITPDEALRHEFVTLAHLTEHAHCDNVNASVQMMKVCRRPDSVVGETGSSGPAQLSDSVGQSGGNKRRLPPELFPLKKRFKMLNPPGAQTYDTSPPPPPPPPEDSNKNNNRRPLTEAEAIAVEGLLSLGQ